MKLTIARGLWTRRVISLKSYEANVGKTSWWIGETYSQFN